MEPVNVELIDVVFRSSMLLEWSCRAEMRILWGVFFSKQFVFDCWCWRETFRTAVEFADSFRGFSSQRPFRRRARAVGVISIQRAVWTGKRAVFLHEWIRQGREWKECEWLTKSWFCSMFVLILRWSAHILRLHAIVNLPPVQEEHLGCDILVDQIDFFYIFSPKRWWTKLCLVFFRRAIQDTSSAKLISLRWLCSNAVSGISGIDRRPASLTHRTR